MFRGLEEAVYEHIPNEAYNHLAYLEYADTALCYLCNSIQCGINNLQSDLFGL